MTGAASFITQEQQRAHYASYICRLAGPGLSWRERERERERRMKEKTSWGVYVTQRNNTCDQADMGFISEDGREVIVREGLGLRG